jgi:SAM-dependent methyltransferase
VNRAVNTSVRLFSETFDPKGPVVELGSLYLVGWEHVADLRPHFPGREYIGCDIRQGLGVDRIEDAEALSFDDDSVGTVVMCELLPHLPRPSHALNEALRVLRDDGLLAVSVPFRYRINGFPSDYWRFTSSGLHTLLDDFADKCVFALGPQGSPAVVFGVAAKRRTDEFSAAKEEFQRLVQEEFARARLRAHLSVMKRASREVVGTLLGRANLGVVFFDPAQGGGYVDQAVRMHGGESGEDMS